MDRFEDLRAFVQVVESGSLTKAAQSLQVATSAISRRIKDLEARLGAQLLQRTTRTMRLTAAGEGFHARATQILQALEEAESEAGNDQRALTGPLRIAAPLSFGQSHLTPILLDFARQHPDLQLDVDLSDRMVDLVAERHDLAVRIGQLRDSSLIARKLADVRLVMCAAPALLKRRGIPETPADLAGLPALFYNGSDGNDSWRFTAPDGTTGTIDKQVHMRATNGDFLREAAIAGQGIALQPSFIVHKQIRQGQLVEILPGYVWPKVTIHIVYPQTRHLSARARAFIDFARERIGPRPDWEDCLG